MWQRHSCHVPCHGLSATIKRLYLYLGYNVIYEHGYIYIGIYQ